MSVVAGYNPGWLDSDDFINFSKMPLSYQTYSPIVILVIIAILSVAELVKYLRSRRHKSS